MHPSLREKNNTKLVIQLCSLQKYICGNRELTLKCKLKCYRPRHTMRQMAATRRCDKSPRLHCSRDKSLALSLSLRYVARIQTSLNLSDRSQRRNSVAATMIFTCHTRRFVAATCRGDVSQRFVASCVSVL